MVVMDNKEYKDKSNNLLAQPACRPIPRDPTKKIKAKLVTILRNSIKETHLDDSTYKGAAHLSFMGFPRSTSQTPSKAYCVQQRISNLRSGLGTYKDS